LRERLFDELTDGDVTAGKKLRKLDDGIVASSCPGRLCDENRPCAKALRGKAKADPRRAEPGPKTVSTQSLIILGPPRVKEPDWNTLQP